MCYGFAPSALSWIGNYLSNRTQRVFFNGCFSGARNVECGIPQGSLLGPDLPLALKKTCVSMYADHCWASYLIKVIR